MASSRSIDDDHARAYHDSAIESDDDSLDGIGSKHEERQDTSLLRVSRPLHSSKRRLSYIEEDEIQDHVEQMEPARRLGWMDLPRKRQLAILTIARLSEPLVQTSLQSYMIFQLKSFDESLPDAAIASQAGMLQASFTAAQFCSAMLWGRFSDHERGGRKKVLLIGLIGTMFSCLGFGFAKTFWQAMLFRSLGGVLNGNVGVMRTMISEIVIEKKYQFAFTLLPMCFNVGVIIGPILGGLLADLASSYPNTFGGVAWLKTYPFAPPNILSTFILFIGAIFVFFGLEETLPSIRHHEDFGSMCGRKIMDIFRRSRGNDAQNAQKYTALAGDEQNQRQGDIEMVPATPRSSKPNRKKEIPRYKQKLPFRRMFTRNVICTFIAHGILACHIGTFNSLWFTFLSTPAADPSNTTQQLPFQFTGGLGMPARHVGLAMAILGAIGITLILFVYPTVMARLGVVKAWRIFLFCFPVAYILVPYLAVVPSTSTPPAEKSGIIFWICLCCVLFIQVLGRTFALPATIILINNCSPHPSVLGTIHASGQMISSLARTLGPVLGGWIFGVGLSHGFVGAVWWILSGVALCACFASRFVAEGDGHEIMLEGDAEAEEEYEATASAARAAK